MRAEEIHEKTLLELINEALSNGKIDESEFKILQLVSQDVGTYVDHLNKFRSKGAITKDDGKILRKYKSTVWENAKKSSVMRHNSEEVERMVDRLETIIYSKYRKY